MKAYLEEWLRTYAKVHCKPSTYRGYRRAVDHHLVPSFGDRLLHLLKREDIKRLIAKHIEGKKARGTIKTT